MGLGEFASLILMIVINQLSKRIDFTNRKGAFPFMQNAVIHKLRFYDKIRT